MNSNLQQQILPQFGAFADLKYRGSGFPEISAPSISLNDDSKSLLIRHAVINMHLPCAEDNREMLAKAGERTNLYLGVFEALRADCPTRRQHLSSLLKTMPEVGVLVARFICSCDKYPDSDKEEIKSKLKRICQSDYIIKEAASMNAEGLAAKVPEEFSLLLQAMYFNNTSAITTLAQKPEFRAFAGACSFMQTFDTGTGPNPDLDRIVSEVCPSLAQYAKDNPDRKGCAEQLLPLYDCSSRDLSRNISRLISLLVKAKKGS